MSHITIILLLIFSSISWASDNLYGIDKSISLPDNVCDGSDCWTQFLGASSMIYLTGGLCMDDPMVIIALVGKSDNDLPAYSKTNFSKVCEIEGKDEKLFDRPPTTFSCKSEGNLMISGATYVKDEAYVVKQKENKQQDIVDSRAYIYKCIKGCINAPERVAYFLHDCG